MKQIQASVAKARLSELLDEVERGETIAITRHGRQIARIVPENDASQRQIRQVIADIKELRRHTEPATREEILAWRDEGRK
jgi:prevent-host-death family protein